jgi:Holliday junction resolvasome RuvABC endonuclease subunit
MKLNLISEKPIRICSIDASTNNLAFAIFENDSLINYGKIDFVGKDIYAKINDAAEKTGPVFEKFNIDAIVIEHAVYINSPKTMSELSMVQGALLGSAMRSGIKRVGSTNPITWQTYIGNGKLTKEARSLIRKTNPGKSDSWYKQFERETRKQKTINFININYDLNIEDNDIADAIGIGHYAINNWSKISA